MLRKRRSLIASGGPASPNEPGAEPAEASPGAAPEPAEPPAAEPTPAEPEAAASEAAAPEAPFAAEPEPPPAGIFGGEPSDPFGGVADPFGDGPPSDPFGGFDEIRAEVKESANAAGRHYTDHGSATARNDTTDSGWGGGAFGGGHSDEAALPSGWGGATPAPAPSRSSSLGSQKPIRSAFGEDEPPTEELPSATFDDRAPAMGAPMNVPEPPPIPGLFDRFTPAPPVARGAGKSFGAGPAGAAEPIRPRFEPTAAPTRPSYLDEEPAAPKPEQSKPLPRTPTKPKDEDDDDDDEAAPSGGIPFPLILGGVAVAVGMFLMLIALVVVQMTSGSDPAPPQAPIAVPVPVARTIVVPPPVPAALDTDAPSMEETTGTTVPTTATPATATADPTKTPPTTTTPKATKPKATATTTTTPKASGATGTLKIRSNRRVLIKVNGKPRDYSPLDLPIAPGTYTVSAALAGKPESEQTVTVTLQSSAIEPVNFTF